MVVILMKAHLDPQCELIRGNSHDVPFFEKHDLENHFVYLLNLLPFLGIWCTFFRQNKMFYKIQFSPSSLSKLCYKKSVLRKKKKDRNITKTNEFGTSERPFFVTKTPQESISFYGSQGFLFTLPFPLHMAHFCVYITSYTEVCTYLDKMPQKQKKKSDRIRGRHTKSA